ncbi:MAG: transporter substrate-binding domain-containing protein, partial [Methyloprofundus sp.]|nr:transporter substrate-binding domain-containing protein [Methyloprofundus sp.]
MLLPRFFLILLFSLLNACDALQSESAVEKAAPASDTQYNSQLERVKKTGLLTVLTRYDPTTYYESADGFSGLEYDLVQLFAQHLKVKAKFIIPDTFAQILKKTQAGEADFSAAGITITPDRQQQFLFTPPYQEITEQIIYRSGTKQPKTVADLNKGIL